MGDQRLRKHDPPLLVGFDRIGIGVERGGEIVMGVAEQVEPIERPGQGVKRRLRPGLDTGMGVRRAQHQGAGAALVERPQGGTERRRHGDPSLAVQFVLVGAQKVGHPARCLFAVGRSIGRVGPFPPGRVGPPGRPPPFWEIMGYHGKLWASKEIRALT